MKIADLDSFDPREIDSKIHGDNIRTLLREGKISATEYDQLNGILTFLEYSWKEQLTWSNPVDYLRQFFVLRRLSILHNELRQYVYTLADPTTIAGDSTAVRARFNAQLIDCLELFSQIQK